MGRIIELYLKDCEELVNLRLADPDAKGRAPNTLAAHRQALAAGYIGDLFARPAAAITRLEIRSWHRQLAARPNRKLIRKGIRKGITGMADMSLRSLRAAYNWAIDAQLVQHNPCLRVERLRVPRSAPAFTDVQLETYRAALPVHLQHRCRRTRGLAEGHARTVQAHNPIVVLQLLDLTGARPAEVLALRDVDVDLDRKVLYIERPKTHEHLRPHPVTQNPCQERPLSTRALVVLGEQLRRVRSLHNKQRTPVHERWLFPMQRSGAPLAFATLYEVHRAVLAVADLPIGFTLYSFRGTFVTRCYEEGVGEEGIQAAVGHGPGSPLTSGTYRKRLPRKAYEAGEAHSRGRAA